VNSLVLVAKYSENFKRIFVPHPNGEIKIAKYFDKFS
jgi:hypothetical protein